MKSIILILIFSFVSNIQSIQDDFSNFKQMDILPADMPNIKESSNNDFEKDGLLTRITGGKIAKPHQFPYQVGLSVHLSDNSIGWCGGALVSVNFVLTAAHCVNQIQRLTAHFGTHQIGALSPGEIRMELSKNNIIVHEKFEKRSLINDIALLKLPKPVKLSDTIKLIKLPKSNIVLEGRTGVASGWGVYSDTTRQTSKVLRYVELKILPLDNCRRFYGGLAQITNICADGSEGKSVCSGDSGGPLAIAENKEKYLIGLTSFGPSLGCEKGYPAVFTKVSAYLDWIAKHSGVKP